MESGSVVSIRNLDMSYGKNQVLKDINLEIGHGQVIGYIGPNGAGKSTTLKILLGIVQGYTGDVRIFGEKLAAESFEYKRRIGYVPETAEIYDSLTAQEYLTFIGELYGMTFEEANDKARRMLLLFGIDKEYTARINSYSKGMKQKVLITASLIHNPDLLFFDEPLSGLDANSVMVFKEIISALAAQGKTVFYSSHIMDVVERISSRIILLNEGRIVADGSFEELKSQSRDSSLESIFNKLTGFNEYQKIADEYIATVCGA